MKAWLERRMPDVVATFARFPLAIILDALAVATLIATLYEVSWLPVENGRNLFFGLVGGAIFAVGGALFRESRPTARVAGIVLAYILPVAVAALGFITDMSIVFVFPLAGAGVMWTSVAAFTAIGRGADRELNQDRFWWLNQRAVIAAGITIGAYICVLIGIAAIERAFYILFQLSTGDVLYRWVLVILGGFLAPIYWLSTVPKLADYDESKLREPDFLTRATSVIAQFVGAPLLVIYGLILLAYGVQILVTRTLPEGLLGWMVIGFVIAGAGNFLLLYAPFLRDRPIVRFYRRWWFWLTVVPLVLFGIAVYVRIAAYGLTTERVAIVAAGLWATILTVVFLLRRGDVRLIPAVAGVLLALLAIGPFNMFALPITDQAGRLERSLTAAGPDRAWTRETSEPAGEAIWYLYNNAGKPALDRILAAHDIDPRNASGYYDPSAVFIALDLPQYGTDDLMETLYGSRARNMPIDVAATPTYLGPFTTWIDYPFKGLGFDLHVIENAVVAKRADVELGRADIGAWAFKQERETVTDPVIDIDVEGQLYRLVIDNSYIDVLRSGTSETRNVTQLSGNIFAGPPPSAPPVVIDDSAVRDEPAMLPLPDAATTSP